MEKIGKSFKMDGAISRLFYDFMMPCIKKKQHPISQEFKRLTLPF